MWWLTEKLHNRERRRWTLLGQFVIQWSYIFSQMRMNLIKFSWDLPRVFLESWAVYLLWTYQKPSVWSLNHACICNWTREIPSSELARNLQVWRCSRSSRASPKKTFSDVSLISCCLLFVSWSEWKMNINCPSTSDLSRLSNTPLSEIWIVLQCLCCGEHKPFLFNITLDASFVHGCHRGGLLGMKNYVWTFNKQ